MEEQLCILQKSQAELKEVSERHGKLLIEILQRMEDLRTTKSSTGKTSQTNQVHSILDVLSEQPVLNKDGDPNDEDLSVAGMEPVDFWSVGVQGGESGTESCMEFLRGSPWFFNSFVEGFHGVATVEAIGPDLELTGCKKGDVAEVVVCANNLMVSFQGDEDAVGVGGIKLEVVDGLGDSEEVKELELVGASIENVAEMNGQALSFDSMWGALELGHARRMFELGLGFARSWNVMIGGQVKYGELQIVHQLFNEMPERKVTSWDSLIPAFSQSGRLNNVIVLPERVREHTIVSRIARMMGCARHGRIHEARNLFKQIPKPNLVTWNSMLTGYAQEEASIIHETGLAVTHDITIGDWLEIEKSPAANSLSVVGGHQAVATSYFATPPNPNGSSSGGFDSVAELVSTAFSLWVTLAYLIALFRPTSLNGRTLRWQVLGFTLTLLVGVILVACYLGRTTSIIVTPLARGNVGLSVPKIAANTITAKVLNPFLTLKLAELLISTVQVLLAPVVFGVFLNQYFHNVVNVVFPIITLIALSVVAILYKALLPRMLVASIDLVDELCLHTWLFMPLAFLWLCIFKYAWARYVFFKHYLK